MSVLSGSRSISRDVTHTYIYVVAPGIKGCKRFNRLRTSSPIGYAAANKRATISVCRPADISSLWWALPQLTRAICRALFPERATYQQTQNICITFIQCRPNVFDVGPILYKCYTNVLCLLGVSSADPLLGWPLRHSPDCITLWSLLTVYRSSDTPVLFHVVLYYVQTGKQPSHYELYVHLIMLINTWNECNIIAFTWFRNVNFCVMGDCGDQHNCYIIKSMEHAWTSVCR